MKLQTQSMQSPFDTRVMLQKNAFHFQTQSSQHVLKGMPQLVDDLFHNGKNKDFWETITMSVLTQTRLQFLIKCFFNQNRYTYCRVTQVKPKASLTKRNRNLVLQRQRIETSAGQ